MGLYVNPAPTGFRATPTIWTANNGANNASRLRLDGTKIGDYALASGAFAVCYAGGFVWVVTSAFAPNNLIYKLDPATGGILASWAVTNSPTGVCTDGTTLWISTHSGAGNGWVRQYTYAGAAGLVANVGDNPYGCCYGAGHVWVPNYVSGTITKVRVSDGAVIGNYATLANPFRSCHDLTNVWVVQRGASSVRKFLAATGASLGDSATGADPCGVCTDGTYVYTANRLGNSVTKIRISDGAVIATFAGLATAYDIAFDGMFLWVALFGGGTVAKVRPSDGTIFGPYATDIGPTGVAVGY